ncbi:MAG TPA: hypothetical protein VKQ06_10170 [Gammaproteobacteria bacterium]|nr:hypothetical protein [Gammaproteobacteria bacterium]
MKYPKIPVFVLAATMSLPTAAYAWDWGDDDDEEPFEEARLFFELNDTDGDLGIHGKIDGDEWKYLEIEDPGDRKMLMAWVRGRLRRQGLTELFFESAEPTFDELDPDDFFRRFPEGEYDIEGITLDGEERESEVYLSHIIPAAPSGVTIQGAGDPEDAPVNCDVEELPEIDPTGGITLDWDPVTSSHETLGSHANTDFASIDSDLAVLYYEVVIEVDETPFKTSAFVPADVTEWTFPEDMFDISEEGEYKYEILVRTNIIDDDGEVVTVELEDEGEVIVQVVPGNKSAVESCFAVAE